MLVSHAHRFIYTKTVKTGGTSVESYFERFCMPEGAWEQIHLREMHESAEGIIGYRGYDRGETRPWWNHMPAQHIRDGLGGETWDAYFKFCVVRNPFERCVSAFEHFGPDLPGPLRPSDDDRRALAHLSEPQLGFLNFLRKRPPIDRDKYVIDDAFCLDDVIRYERLSGDVERVCTRLGLPFEPSLIPVYKRREGRGNDGARSGLYSAEARDEVERLFAFELDRFGYSFPWPESP